MYSGSQSAALIDEEKESFLLGLKRVDQIIKEESNPLLKKVLLQCNFNLIILNRKLDQRLQSHSRE